MQAILIKSSGAEALRSAMEAGMITGHMADEAARVLAENGRLEHENMILRGLTARQQAQTAERRAYTLALLKRDAQRRQVRLESRSYRAGLLLTGACAGVLITALAMTAAFWAVMA